MTELIAKTMVELLSVLALATKRYKEGKLSECAVIYCILPVAQRPTEQFLKKLSEEREIADALQRLDRLTQEEVRMAVAQTLGVVHGLVYDVKRLMEGR